jgi:peptide/nickel transport system ATP-binding protein
MPLLETQNLTKRFGGGLLGGAQTVALLDFNLCILSDEPAIVAIAGESGSGKTTAANLILGLLTPSQGSVHFRGVNIHHLDKAGWQRYRREVQAIFQDPYEVFNPFYKVDRVLQSVIRKFGLTTQRDEARDMMCKALETVGLRPDDVLGKFPHELSGGQRQRIMIARAFLTQPRLIVADEPVSMLDASLRGLMLEIMLQLKNDYGISFIYVTHDLSTAYQMSDRIMVLYRGVTVEQGPIDSVITQPRHPYTQMLTAAVPTPDPSVRWPQHTRLAKSQQPPTLNGAMGCNFADRCPQVMAHCRTLFPPIMHVGDDHTATCYLYESLNVHLVPSTPIATYHEPSTL